MAIRAEVDKIRAGGPALAADFVRARRRVLEQLLADSADARSVADELESISAFDLDDNYFTDTARRAGKLTSSDVASLVARELDASREVVVIRGPARLATKMFAAAGIDGVTAIRWRYSRRVSDGPKPTGRIAGATLSVDGAGAPETVSMSETVDAGEPSADFAELREADRDNYVVGDEIARGGMGVIREARDRRTGRSLAIKEVRSEIMSRSAAAVRAAVLRFRREAVLTAQLQHPSIVPVYEIGRFEQTPFIAMKLVRGTGLDRVFAACQTAADRLALLPKVIDVAEAIAYAHAEGVVHRDLKPANVIAGDFGETVVIDWGLAKSGGDGDDDLGMAAAGIDGDVETVAGAVLGTPRYMAPEQAAGRAIGPRADVYALGAILYELLAGEAPYTSDLDERGERASAEDVVDLVTERAPRPIAGLNPDAPADLISIAEKAMARDPGDRYASAAELAADLRAFERGQLVEVHDYSTLDLIRRWVGRHKAVVITAAILAVAGAASTTWFVIQTRDSERRASAELERAMRTLRDRGLDELARGNLQRAAAALGAAYQHLDDEPLRIALADVMAAVDPFVRELYRSPGRLGALDVDGERGRVAIESDHRTRVIDLEGEVLLEVDGGSPAFSGGGEMLVTRRDHRLLISSTRDGSLLRALDVRELRTWIASPALPRLAYIDGDDLVVTSLTDGAELARAEIGTAAALFGEVLLSRDGRFVATATEQALLLDVVTGEVRVLGPMGIAGHKAMSFSPDGSRLAISPRPGQIFLIDTATGAVAHRYKAHGRPIELVAFADRGHVVSLDDDGDLCFYDLERERDSCHLAGRVSYAQVSGGQVLSGHANGTVRVWDLDGGVIVRLAAHADGRTFAIAAGDGRVLSGGDDGALRLWTLAGRRAPWITPGPGETVEIAAPLVFRRRGDELSWRDLRSPARVTSIAVAGPGRPRVDRDGDVIAVGGRVYDRAGRQLARVATPDLSGFALHPRGESAASCTEGGVLSLIDLPSTGVRWTADLSRRDDAASYRQIEFSADGSLVLVALQGTDVVFDAATGDPLASRTHDGRSHALVALRGGSRYVSAVNDRLVTWDASGEITSLELPGRVAIAAATDGARVVVAAGSSIGILDAGSDAIAWLGRGRQTEDPIYAVATSPGGLIAASASDGRIYVYSSDGLLLATRQVRSVKRASFVGDHELLIDGDGAAQLWSLAPERRDPGAITARIDALVSPAR